MVAFGRSETVESELLALNQAIVESGGFEGESGHRLNLVATQQL